MLDRVGLQMHARKAVISAAMTQPSKPVLAKDLTHSSGTEQVMFEPFQEVGHQLFLHLCLCL